MTILFILTIAAVAALIFAVRRDRTDYNLDTVSGRLASQVARYERRESITDTLQAIGFILALVAVPTFYVVAYALDQIR